MSEYTLVITDVLREGNFEKAQQMINDVCRNGTFVNWTTVITAACKSKNQNNVDIVRFLIEKAPGDIQIRAILYSVCRHSVVEIISLLFEKLEKNYTIQSVRFILELVQDTCEAQTQAPVLKFLFDKLFKSKLSNNQKFDSFETDKLHQALFHACAYGPLENVQAFVEKFFEYGQYCPVQGALRNACQYSRDDVVNFLISRYDAINVGPIFTQACSNGSIEIVKLLFDKMYKKSDNKMRANDITELSKILKSMCRHGNFEIAEFLLQNGIKYTHKVTAKCPLKFEDLLYLSRTYNADFTDILKLYVWKLKQYNKKIQEELQEVLSDDVIIETLRYVA
jgi:hypothetical protein